LTHEELRLAAIRFAKRQRFSHRTWERIDGLNLKVIASETVTAAHDIPDVIGWDQTHSYLIECKASRSDFFHDAKKPQRNAGTGMGIFRYYFTPKGLVSREEIPEGWGLIEIDGKEMVISVQAPRRELDASGHMQEKRILLSLLRRVKMREFLIIQRDEMDAALVQRLAQEESHAD
jgi:hypothetical protein